MKAADIKIGEEYAIELFGGYFVRAVVTEIGNPKVRVFSGRRYDFSGHVSTAKRATVQYLHEDGTPTGDPDHVVLAKVICPWADYVERMKSQAERQAELERALRVVEDAAYERGVHLHFARRNIATGLSAGTAVVSASDVRKLMGPTE